MNMMWSVMAFSAALFLAALMGFAIQRGATCTVAAVDELMTTGRATRLAGMAEASLWVAGGLLVAQSAGWLGKVPQGYALGAATVSGAVLLGCGAYINRACVFGTIARLSSGDWAYVLTPVGFYIGCKAFAVLPHAMTPQPLPPGSVWLTAPTVWVWIVLAAMGIRLVVAAVRAHQKQPFSRLETMTQLGARLWSPRPATVVIGISFLLLWLLAGSWAYTDVLAQWAQRHGRSGRRTRGRWSAALFAGALWGWAIERTVAFSAAQSGDTVAQRVRPRGFFDGLGQPVDSRRQRRLDLGGHAACMWPYAWIAIFGHVRHDRPVDEGLAPAACYVQTPRLIASPELTHGVKHGTRGGDDRRSKSMNTATKKSRRHPGVTRGHLRRLLGPSHLTMVDQRAQTVDCLSCHRRTKLCRSP
jgi:hypothetical protein